VNKQWYYINYRETIDAIKWRMYSIDKIVQGNRVQPEEVKAYRCPRCKSQWTLMEVLDKVDPRGQGFLCHKCSFHLIRNEDQETGGHEQSSRLNQQFRFITDLLPKIDEVVVPENSFDTALSKATPVIRDYLNQTAESIPVDSGLLKPTSVKGLTNTGPTSVAVTLTANDGPTAADKAAELARKEALAVQNQLPAHFTHSTITGEQVVAGSIPTFSTSTFDDKKDSKEFITTPNDGADIDDYFAQLKAEQAREAEMAEEEELESDDEDDEDGFEDVVPATGSGVGTPASSSSMNVGGLANGLTSALKRSADSEKSGTSTSAGSPVTGPQTPDSGRAAKKVRIEEPKDDDEESDEDVEFEDV
jgi:transcription initiation factor TFIIE subunit alpha